MSKGVNGGQPTEAPVRVGVVLSEGLNAQGGIGRVMTYVARHIAAHRPDIAIRPFRARLSTRALLKHLTVPLALARFAVACRTLDIVHINIAPRGSTWRKMAFAAVARRLGRPVLLHLHGSGYDQYYASLSPRRQAMVRRFFAAVDRVVVLSAFWERFMLGQIGVPAARVVVIPNGVPAADPPAAQRPETAAPLILFLGVVGERKGIDVLLDALAGLARDGFGWRAVVGGNGAVDEAKARAQALGLGDRIDFLGWVGEERVDALLREADIYVLPSRAENQPVAILEAMARATPVIASRVGGIPEQLAGGEAGLLVDPGDAVALGEALARLIRDPALRTQLGQAGLARFAAHYALSTSADRLADLYRSLAARRGR